MVLMITKDKDVLNDTQDIEESCEETEEEVCAACMIRYSKDK